MVINWQSFHNNQIINFQPQYNGQSGADCGKMPYERNDRRSQISCRSRRARSFEINRRESIDKEKTSLNNFRTQFDQHVNHNQSHHMMAPMQIPTIVPAPEVVLEIPSDSDSSRRPSHCSIFQSDCSPDISTSPSLWKFKQSSLKLDIPQHSRLTRRASHGGESSSPNDQFLGSLLDVPRPRERIYSLPSTVEAEELYMLRSFSIQGKRVVNRGDSIRSRRGSRTSISSRGSR